MMGQETPTFAPTTPQLDPLQESLSNFKFDDDDEESKGNGVMDSLESIVNSSMPTKDQKNLMNKIDSQLF